MNWKRKVKAILVTIFIFVQAPLQRTSAAPPKDVCALLTPALDVLATL